MDDNQISKSMHNFLPGSIVLWRKIEQDKESENGRSGGGWTNQDTLSLHCRNKQCQHRRGFAWHKFIFCSHGVCCGCGWGGSNAGFLLSLLDLLPLIFPAPPSGLEAPTVCCPTVPLRVHQFPVLSASARGSRAHQGRWGENPRGKHPQPSVTCGASAPGSLARASQPPHRNSRTQRNVILWAHRTWGETNILFFSLASLS